MFEVFSFVLGNFLFMILIATFFVYHRSHLKACDYGKF